MYTSPKQTEVDLQHLHQFVSNIDYFNEVAANTISKFSHNENLSLSIATPLILIPVSGLQLNGINQDQEWHRRFSIETPTRIVKKYDHFTFLRVSRTWRRIPTVCLNRSPVDISFYARERLRDMEQTFLRKQIDHTDERVTQIEMELLTFDELLRRRELRQSERVEAQSQAAAWQARLAELES